MEENKKSSDIISDDLLSYAFVASILSIPLQFVIRWIGTGLGIFALCCGVICIVTDKPEKGSKKRKKAMTTCIISVISLCLLVFLIIAYILYVWGMVSYLQF